MDYSFEAVVERVKGHIQSKATLIEGTWTMDNIQAFAQEIAMFAAMEVSLIPDRVLLDTAPGEYLDRKAKEFGESRLPGEDDETFRSRILFKIQNPTNGSNLNQYVHWARQVPGVGEAKGFETWRGANTVKVVILAAGHTTPSDELVTQVFDYIEERRPVCVELTVEAAVPKPAILSVSVVLKAGYSLGDVKREISENLDSYISSLSFGQALSYYRAGDAIFSADGVADIQSFTLNGGQVSLQGSDEEYFQIQEVTVNVITR